MRKVLIIHIFPATLKFPFYQTPISLLLVLIFTGRSDQFSSIRDICRSAAKMHSQNLQFFLPVKTKNGVRTVFVTTKPQLLCFMLHAKGLRIINRKQQPRFLQYIQLFCNITGLNEATLKPVYFLLYIQLDPHYFSK